LTTLQATIAFPILDILPKIGPRWCAFPDDLLQPLNIALLFLTHAVA
jgi:hypothetical protein